MARALEWKHPVKLQSLPEEEFKTGRYRAMAVHRVRAGADASVPTAAPALTNAIAALTGTRIRRLPVTRTIKIY